jgi:hypothetical protein
MPLAANFNPEWGYLAPTPSLVRTIRVAAIAATVGATAGAAVVFSLVERPAAEQSVAARTLVQPVTTVSPPIDVSTTRNAANAETASVVAGSVAARRSPVAGEPGESSTTQRPPSTATLAVSPAVTDASAVQSPVQGGNESATAPDRAPAQKKPVTKTHVTPRYYDQAARGPLALLPPSGARAPNGDYYGQRGEY